MADAVIRISKDSKMVEIPIDKPVVQELTRREREVIERNLAAFESNFGKPKIIAEDYGEGKYVFFPADSDSYIQYCHNIDYLDGWLYGVVQGIHRRVFRDNCKL